MKLTQKQQIAMDMIEMQIEDGNGYAYCETGKYKPFNLMTLQSLVNKKLITLEYRMEGVYYARFV